MQISVLDQSPIRENQPHDASIRESIGLAQHCEALGYARYWLSEHHSSDAVAGSAPEILMAAIAATTSRIRVGSAGVMLPHYSALKIAEQFRVLEAIAPGRIDLGVGRAPGSDGRTAMALNPNAAQAADHFPAQLRDLQAWTADQPLPAGHPFRAVKAEPTGPLAPQIWVLGSSDYGAQLAAYFGLPYCFAYFFAGGAGAAQALKIYRETYRPSALNPKPHAAITAWVLAAPSREEAEHHALSYAFQRLMFERGRFSSMPSPETVLAHPFAPPERAQLAAKQEAALIGTAADVAARLRMLVMELQLDELVVTTGAYDPVARRDSFTLLAQEFGISQGQIAA